MEALFQTNPWLVAPAFVTIWVLITWLLSQISGWSVLAEHYGAFDAYDGEKRGFQTIEMRRWKLFPATYSGIVGFGGDVRGLHVAIFVLFRPYHPPLTIPWPDITLRSKSGIFGLMATMAFARAPGIEITLPAKTAAWIAGRSGGQLRSG